MEPLGGWMRLLGSQVEPFGGRYAQAVDNVNLPVDVRLEVRAARGRVQLLGRQTNLEGLAPVFCGTDAVRVGVLSRGQLRGQRCGDCSRACTRRRR